VPSKKLREEELEEARAIQSVMPASGIAARRRGDDLARISAGGRGGAAIFLDYFQLTDGERRALHGRCFQGKDYQRRCMRRWQWEHCAAFTRRALRRTMWLADFETGG